jgi:uncharacterized membrane protein
MTIFNISPTYQFALISGFAWAITTIVAKQYLLKSFDPMEMYILRMGLGFPILALLLVFILSNSNSSSNLSKSSTTLNPKNTINYAHQLLKKIKTHITPKLFVIFSISIIAGFLGIYMFWKVLESNNGAYSVAFVWPLVVLFTTIISYFFYNEKISTTQFIGIALVILGIFMLNIE